MQPLHHRLELGDLAPGRAGGVAQVGREEGDRVVAPVVGEPARGERGLGGELVHRHELDGGHPERDEMLDDDIMPSPR